MPISATYPLHQSPLYRLRSRSRLAQLLRLSNAELRNLERRNDLYREFDLPKKNGGVRHVENPVRALKLVQARIARILGRIEPPHFLFCPVKRRCNVSNAAAHMGNRVVHCLDIKKFFPNTPQRRVYWFFHTIMRCESNIAGLLAKLACYTGHLPTGSPLSPIMAYFAYFDLWHRIADFCKDRGYTLTVYIDDITISGHRVPTSDMWAVRQMIHGAGLRYHKAKSFVDRPAEITGVIVRPEKIEAPFRQHKKMRDAKVSLSSADAEDKPALRAQIAGIAGQIRQIRGFESAAHQKAELSKT